MLASVCSVSRSCGICYDDCLTQSRCVHTPLSAACDGEGQCVRAERGSESHGFSSFWVYILLAKGELENNHRITMLTCIVRSRCMKHDAVQR